MGALATLYTYEGQYDKTLHIYLRLKRPEAFSLIEKYSLFGSVQDKVALLMDFDQKRAISLFVKNTHSIPVAQVMQQLQGQSALQHAYLHALFLEDSQQGTDFNIRRVELYAQHDRDGLMPFLRQSIYPLEKAYEVCCISLSLSLSMCVSGVLIFFIFFFCLSLLW